MSRALSKLRRAGRTAWLQMASLGLAIALSFVGAAALAQTAVKVPKVEEKDKAERAVVLKVRHPGSTDLRAQRRIRRRAIVDMAAGGDKRRAGRHNKGRSSTRINRRRP